MSLNNLSVARDVLSWVAGSDVDFGGINAWLCAFLLDDPPQITGQPPGVN